MNDPNDSGSPVPDCVTPTPPDSTTVDRPNLLDKLKSSLLSKIIDSGDVFEQDLTRLSRKTERRVLSLSLQATVFVHLSLDVYIFQDCDTDIDVKMIFCGWS